MIPKREVGDGSDPWATAVNRTGCVKEYEAVEKCQLDHRDWRKCQAEVLAFRECLERTKAAVDAKAAVGVVSKHTVSTTEPPRST